jgi:putative FmdB family regulatory protein
MPIYEYVCNACGHEFEEWQKITDTPVQKCPSCNKRKVERLVSLSAFHLKGSGWYVTDYAGKKSGSSSNDKKAEDKNKDKTKPSTESPAKSDSTTKDSKD